MAGTTAFLPAPAGTRRGRALLLAAVAACAACGLIYELVLLTLSANLSGGGITQTSLIVAGYVAALGAGALLASPFSLTRQPHSSRSRSCSAFSVASARQGCTWRSPSTA